MRLSLPRLVGRRHENGGGELSQRLAGELSRVADAGGLPAGPDPPGVEHVEVRVDEELGPLDEERALLLVVGLERGEVEDRRVGLDLPEVGLEGGVEREVGRDAVLEVGAEVALVVPALVRRPVGGGIGRIGGAAHHVRHDLELAGRADAVESRDGAGAAHESLLVTVPVRPGGPLSQRVDVLKQVQTPGHRRGRPVPDRREGEPDLGVPPVRVP